MSGVGSRLVFEDDRVRVWHLDLEPGEQCEQHTHQLDYVARIVAGSTVEVLGPHGESLYAVTREPGDAVAFHVEGDQIVTSGPDSRTIPATHSARNVGDQTFREVLVEFKK